MELWCSVLKVSDVVSVVHEYSGCSGLCILDADYVAPNGLFTNRPLEHARHYSLVAGRHEEIGELFET